MECKECGASMELIMYSDDTGDYFTWVCYVCAIGYRQAQYGYYEVCLN